MAGLSVRAVGGEDVVVEELVLVIDRHSLIEKMGVWRGGLRKSREGMPS